MFSLGSDQVAPYMRGLLRTLAPFLNEIPNELSISGHTDSIPYVGSSPSYSNWELSSDRALASRRELIAGGLDGNKLLRVSGLADNALRGDTAPISPSNRRIELIVLYAATAENIRRPQSLPEKTNRPDWLAQAGPVENVALPLSKNVYPDKEQ
jgi:chemotaxis protein MotB